MHSRRAAAGRGRTDFGEEAHVGHAADVWVDDTADRGDEDADAVVVVGQGGADEEVLAARVLRGHVDFEGGVVLGHPLPHLTGQRHPGACE